MISAVIRMTTPRRQSATRWSIAAVTLKFVASRDSSHQRIHIMTLASHDDIKRCMRIWYSVVNDVSFDLGPTCLSSSPFGYWRFWLCSGHGGCEAGFGFGRWRWAWRETSTVSPEGSTGVRGRVPGCLTVRASLRVRAPVRPRVCVSVVRSFFSLAVILPLRAVWSPLQPRRAAA